MSAGQWTTTEVYAPSDAAREPFAAVWARYQARLVTTIREIYPDIDQSDDAEWAEGRRHLTRK